MKTAQQILQDAHTIAVVGASRNRYKPAHWAPETLQQQGWRIIPVNPHATEVLGERAYARLTDIPEQVDVVDVFRPASEAVEIVRQAITIGARAVWLEQGLSNPAAHQLAAEAGLEYVEDASMAMERALHSMVRPTSPA